MSEKKDQIIGIRFTSRERELIEDFAEKRNSSLTEFMRESIFSHINNLVDSPNKIDLDVFLKNFKQITNATRIINKSIDKLKKNLEIDDLINLIIEFNESSVSEGDLLYIGKYKKE